jgi:lactate dehydrogenase-like 2-hydroxyacid dehydrogenase
MPVLLITRRLPPAVEARAAASFTTRLNHDDSAIDVAAMAAGADAVLCCAADKMTTAVIAALPDSVRVIGSFSVGMDHIDLAACRARGIPVVNTPDVLTDATAELTMLLILAAARRSGEGERILRAGAWTGWAPTQLMGSAVSGRRLGIFGMGRIGQAVARMARGFGMQVHYRNRNRLDPALEQGAQFHESDATFLPVCDILSLNAPGGADTYHWLDAERIAKLPEGAIIANAARGTLVDDTALIAALRSGRIAAAGLDVFEGEPKLHPDYLTLENVALLPHLGSATVATRNAMGMLALDGIEAVLAGRVPGNIVA